MREKIRLMSSAGTGHYYTTTKNRRLHPEKMEVTKYDPRVRKHVIYKETKIKSLVAPRARRKTRRKAGFCFGGSTRSRRSPSVRPRS